MNSTNQAVQHFIPARDKIPPRIVSLNTHSYNHTASSKTYYRVVTCREHCPAWQLHEKWLKS